MHKHTRMKGGEGSQIGQATARSKPLCQRNRGYNTQNERCLERGRIMHQTTAKEDYVQIDGFANEVC